MDASAAELVERWRGGDECAAREIYDRYARRLIALAQARLSLRMAQRIDPEDVIQSVFRSFFVAAREGRYDLRHSGDLWRLLLGITRHKFLFRVHYHAAGKRSPARETAVDACDGNLTELVSREPSPEEAVALTDLLEQALGGFDATGRRIVELRLQGHTLEDVARAVGRCRHTVLRTIERFKDEVRRTDDLHAEP